MSQKVKNSMSELILSAVFHLQQKNGVSVMEIAQYVGEKRSCKPCGIRDVIKIALTKAKKHGIMSESKGKYRIECPYEDKIKKSELKPEKKDDDFFGGDEVDEDLCKVIFSDNVNESLSRCCPEGAADSDCVEDAEEEPQPSKPNGDGDDEEDDDEDDDDDDEDDEGMLKENGKHSGNGEPLSKKRKMNGNGNGNGKANGKANGNGSSKKDDNCECSDNEEEFTSEDYTKCLEKQLRDIKRGK